VKTHSFLTEKEKTQVNGLMSTFLIMQWWLADGQQAKVKGAHAQSGLNHKPPKLL